MDVRAPTDERQLLRTAKSCGPGAPRAGAKLATMHSHRAGDGGKRNGSPRRARISRKPPRREGRLSPPVPVVHARSRNFLCACGPGCSGHPAFPAPSAFEGGRDDAKLGRIPPRGCELMSPRLSCPAQAGHPVARGCSARTSMSLEYWIVRSSRTMTMERVAV